MGRESARAAASTQRFTLGGGDLCCGRQGAPRAVVPLAAECQAATTPSPPGSSSSPAGSTAPPPPVWLCITQIVSWSREGMVTGLAPAPPLGSRGQGPGARDGHGRTALHRAPILGGRQTHSGQQDQSQTSHLKSQHQWRNERRTPRPGSQSSGRGSSTVTAHRTEMCGMHSQDWGGGKPPEADLRGGEGGTWRGLGARSPTAPIGVQ
jgi:hypothetical protein